MLTQQAEKQVETSNSNFITRTICPCCQSNSLTTLYASAYDKPPVETYLKGFYASRGGVEFEYLKGAEYCLTKCNNCSLIFQKHIPNDMLMERLYEHWIDPKVAQEKQLEKNFSDYTYYASEIMQIIAYFNKTPSSLHFFDFGMGWAKWSLMAKGFGCESYGTELSEERIKYAKANGIKVITWEDIPTHSFDFINTEQVFEHISEPLETLRYLKSGLKPGGIIKISVPTDPNIERKLQNMDWTTNKKSKNSLNAVAPLEHINCYTTDSLIKMADAAGLEEVIIPMKIQYQYSINWYGFKNIARNILKPFNQNIRKRNNYLFFRKKLS